MKQLIILSGADRVGKSTLASKMEKEGVCRVRHFGPPPPDRPLFSDLRDEINLWLLSDDPQLVFDRSYVCSYCLDQPNVLDAILAFEWDHRHLHIKHIGVWASWREVAQRHIEEIQTLEIDDHIREYRTRMETHQTYYKRLEEFYENVTMFPHTWAR